MAFWLDYWCAYWPNSEEGTLRICFVGPVAYYEFYIAYPINT
jgi:hypothetical protein